MIDWYQTIPELGIKGRFNTPEEFDKIGLPENLDGKTVLDIGCNSGAYLVECAERAAEFVHGIENDLEWRLLAMGILWDMVWVSTSWEVYPGFEVYPEKNHRKFDLVLLLSVTHVVEGMTGQEILDKAYEFTEKGGLLIVEINDRLQKEPINLPKGAKLYGQSKDERSVYHIRKN